jgi:hypothetical protein
MSTKSEIDLQYELTEAVGNLVATGFEEFQILAISRFVEALCKARDIIPDDPQRWQLILETIRSSFSDKRS